MTKDEALRLALEALETPWNAPYVNGCDLALGKKVKAIAAIKEALAQPEQDWIERERAVGYREAHRAALAQRTWVGLTDEELSQIEGTHIGRSFAKAIEAKLKDKNAGR